MASPIGLRRVRVSEKHGASEQQGQAVLSWAMSAIVAVWANILAPRRALGALKRVQGWFAAALAIATLVLSGPVQSQLTAPTPEHLESGGIESLETPATHASNGRRPVAAAVGCFSECEESVVCDAAGEVEAEWLAATEHHAKLRRVALPAETDLGGLSSGESFKPAEWVRDQHAPRGPPRG